MASLLQHLVLGVASVRHYDTPPQCGLLVDAQRSIPNCRVYLGLGVFELNTNTPGIYPQRTKFAKFGFIPILQGSQFLKLVSVTEIVYDGNERKS